MTTGTTVTQTSELKPIVDLTRESPASFPIELNDQYPARKVGMHWKTTDLDADKAISLVLAKSNAPRGSRQWTDLQRGLTWLLGWLWEAEGTSFEERFVASGAEAAGADWHVLPIQWLERRGEYSPICLALIKRALCVAIAADIVRPSFGWLLTGAKHYRLVPLMATMRDPEGFTELATHCELDEAITVAAANATRRRVAMILATRGGVIADITIGDLLEAIDAETAAHGETHFSSATFKMLREMGGFGPGVPTLEEIRSNGQRSVEELVGSYAIACEAVRDLLVDYLSERRPAVDYSTLSRLAYELAGSFWSDIEAHHPGICSLHLPAEVAVAWKQRLLTKTTREKTPPGKSITATSERLAVIEVMASVRAFYLDLSEWALTDPKRWGRWVAPCPIGRQELSRRKNLRRRKARMDARTRERLPILPVLVEVTNRWRKDAAALLVAAQSVKAGATFSVAGESFVRSVRPGAEPGRVWVDDPSGGGHRLLNREEDHAFWAWAIIEVLSLTGVRVEELLELSHHSLVEYRLPSTGEIVPLLSVAPSKTDTERLLVVSPELAEVLEAIILRVRNASGMVPLVRARDYLERAWATPSPLLFQHVHRAERHALSVKFVRDILDEAVARTGLIDQHDGTPLRYVPHDFRRIFITDVIRGGLPPHIAQVIAGHESLNVTMAYKAVYPDEAIQAHLAFLARRRALRPSEEYRTPTDEEWSEFLGSFERRKVSIGICGRAFQTPCAHEHACVRCSMLWPDPAQKARLVEVRDNLTARIEEAKREGWVGEVEGLELSLASAVDKLAQIDQHTSTQAVELRALNYGHEVGVR
ncbi:MAG: tyrosine-type recombinase/integrase [Acidimicrobiales bacterium]